MARPGVPAPDRSIGCPESRCQGPFDAGLMIALSENRRPAARRMPADGCRRCARRSLRQARRSAHGDMPCHAHRRGTHAGCARRDGHPSASRGRCATIYRPARLAFARTRQIPAKPRANRRCGAAGPEARNATCIAFSGNGCDARCHRASRSARRNRLQPARLRDATNASTCVSSPSRDTSCPAPDNLLQRNVTVPGRHATNRPAWC